MYEEETRSRSRLSRLGWAVLLLLTAGAIGWYAVNNVEPLRSAWADFRGEKPPTWADVGSKIQEFMDQQPIVMPRTEPAPPAPPPPAMTPTPP